MTDPVAPRTHAEASRQRKDVVLGEATDESRLIRFVEGPGGIVVPDLARKLPGRGIWVGADRAS
ncbi:DNA-binding protein, partial [Pseudomonas sp. HMWF010]